MLATANKLEIVIAKTNFLAFLDIYLDNVSFYNMYNTLLK